MPTLHFTHLQLDLPEVQRLEVGKLAQDVESVVWLLHHRVIQEAEVGELCEAGEVVELGQARDLVARQDEALEGRQLVAEVRPNARDEVVRQHERLEPAHAREVVELRDLIVAQVDRVELVLQKRTSIPVRKQALLTSGRS